MSRRKFLVIADDSPESVAALRYACKRAVSTGGHVCLLRVIEPAVFEHWSGVREEMERQAIAEAEAFLQKMAEFVIAETGAAPEFIIVNAESARQACAASSPMIRTSRSWSWAPRPTAGGPAPWCRPSPRKASAGAAATCRSPWCQGN